MDDVRLFTYLIPDIYTHVSIWADREGYSVVSGEIDLHGLKGNRLAQYKVIYYRFIK